MPVGDNPLSFTSVTISYLYIFTCTVCITEKVSHLYERLGQTIRGKKEQVAVFRQTILKYRPPSIIARVNSRMFTFCMKKGLRQYKDNKTSIYCLSERNHHCPLPVLYPRPFTKDSEHFWELQPKLSTRDLHIWTLHNNNNNWIIKQRWLSQDRSLSSRGSRAAKLSKTWWRNSTLKDWITTSSSRWRGTP